MVNENLTRNTPEHFEALGADRVRFLLSRDGVSEEFSTPAVTWLAELDKEEKDKQVAIAKSAKLASWIAAGLALLAVVVSLCAWLFPQAPDDAAHTAPITQKSHPG